MHETVISNARIVLADEIVDGSVKIVDGIIQDVATNSSVTGTLDFEGDLLIPGLVELHTDNLERHAMPRPKSYWPIESAVLNHDREVSAAGITTVFDALCIGHMDQGSRSIESITEMANSIDSLSAKGSLKAEHFLHWRCEVASADVLNNAFTVSENSRTGLFSVMDHTPGQRQFVSLDAYYTYYQGKYGLNDQQMEQYMTERRAVQEKYSAPNRREIVKLAHSKSVPIASHDDATIEHVDEAIEDGIVVAEFPTTLEAANASHKNNLAVLMGAPNVVRGKSHSGNVSARELASEGLLDILSSDYVPFSLLYGAVLLEKHCDNITLPQAIATVSKNPANQVGLNDRGEIAQGKKADLVRFRMDAEVPNVVEVWKNGSRVA
ncbi:MAG: alpha-D-ribose 1-methylphosphonate 5-triphosphate diphosphatase [Pseudomonadota bacterium]